MTLTLLIVGSVGCSPTTFGLTLYALLLTPYKCIFLIFHISISRNRTSRRLQMRDDETIPETPMRLKSELNKHDPSKQVCQFVSFSLLLTVVRFGCVFVFVRFSSVCCVRVLDICKQSNCIAVGRSVIILKYSCLVVIRISSTNTLLALINFYIHTVDSHMNTSAYVFEYGCVCQCVCVYEYV